MGRLFSSASDESEIEPANDIQELEKPQETNSPQRPAFRFPMITDAEIYGWDEDSQEQQPIKKQPSPTSIEEEQQPESIPLFKNNRWPAEPSIGEIHRAGAKTKYKEFPEVTQKVSPKSVKQVERKTEIVKQRTNKPFKPTEVPSPVYGFSKPKKTSVNVEHELSTKSEEQRVNKQRPPTNLFLPDEILPSGRNLFASSEEQKTTEPTVDSTTDYVLEQRDTSSEDSRMPALEEERVEPETTNSEEQQLLVNPTPPIMDSHVVESVVEERITERVQVAVLDYEEPTEEQIIEVSDATLLTETDEVNVPEKEQQSELFEETIPSTEQPEKRQEKIMPFNVVMLKTDKQKHQLRTMANANTETPSRVENNVLPTVAKPEVVVRPNVQSTHQMPIQKKMTPQQAEPVQQTSLPEVISVQPEPEEEVLPHYVFPSIEDLVPPEAQQEDTEWLTSQSEKLVEALSHFAVEAEILEAVQGPTVTRFELTVGFGTKVSKVRNLTDDLKLALAAEDIRIQAPIPGTSSIGIEIPNRTTRPVRISEVINTERFSSSDSPLEAVLGLSLTGEPVTIDLRKMPHGMIAGATGSGKSVCINSILISLLYKASPVELKMMLIDPKMVELAPYNGIPHLITPVITDVKAATAALKWAVEEMERRYELFAHAGARNIERYNEMAEANRQFSQKMPYLLLVIDELADLMMVAPNDVEVSISRIAQKARACGIHLIIATQRPSVDVITGIIKANIPTRIAFSVSSQIDSRTIIDSAGAERLLGRGDMLYVGNGQSSSIRLQGTFVTDDEIERIIEHVKSEASPEYLFGQEDLLAAVVEEEETDPLFKQACSFIIEQGSASTSLMQRHFSIGYNRAAKIMDRMEAHGFISEQRGSRSRDVYLTETDLESFLNPDSEA